MGENNVANLSVFTLYLLLGKPLLLSVYNQNSSFAELGIKELWLGLNSEMKKEEKWHEEYKKSIRNNAGSQTNKKDRVYSFVLLFLDYMKVKEW